MPSYSKLKSVPNYTLNLAINKRQSRPVSAVTFISTSSGMKILSRMSCAILSPLHTETHRQCQCNTLQTCKQKLIHYQSESQIHLPASCWTAAGGKIGLDAKLLISNLKPGKLAGIW